MAGLRGPRALADVEAASRAYRVPWDQWTLDKFLLVESFYLAELADQVKEKERAKK